VTYIGPIISAVVIVILIATNIYQRRQLRQSKGAKTKFSEDTVVLSDAVNVDVNSDALFATIPHELRAPLNGLLGIFQTLNEERDDEGINAIEGCARICWRL
jgi:signal transduction histidine kinase